MSGAPSWTEKAYRNAGQWFRAIGYAWVVAGVVLALDVGFATPAAQSGAAHGMVPVAVVQVSLLFTIVFGTAPGIALAILGTQLAKGARLELLGVLMGGFYVVSLSAGVGANIPFPAEYLGRFLAEVIGLLLMLVPTTLLVNGVAEARGSAGRPLLEWLRLRARVLTVAAPVALICVTVALRWASVRGTSRDVGPLWLRANQTLILQAIESPRSPDVREELRRRGRPATQDAVDMLAASPTKQDVLFAPEPSRLEALMGLVAELGGPEAMNEVHRWLAREDASIGVRAAAALALASIHDRASTPAIVQLLDPPDPGPKDSGGNAQRSAVMKALRIMPAPESAGGIRAMLLRQGPTAPSSHAGLVTLRALNTAESKAAYGELREAWRNEWPDLFRDK